MRVFVASIETETNTFAPLPTGLVSFEEYGIHRGSGSRDDPDGVGAFVRNIRAAAERAGHEVIESIAAYAQPGGRLVGPAYAALRDALLEDLQAAMPVHIVQLMLHGAMAADGCDDCEGDIVARIREIAGPEVAVGVELDLHCHMTELMRTSADAIVAFKEYPHIDARERAEELFALLEATAQGRIEPVTAVFDCRMVGLYHTTREPMASFVRRMQSFEGSNGILSVSLGHGFPWGDVADAGTKLWVIADHDYALADKLAQQLGMEFFALRHETGIAYSPMDEALDQALALHDGPVVLADMADNPGGGAPGDSTFILERMIARGIGNVALGTFWDPQAVGICMAAGIGGSLDLRIGGKCGPSSGNPLDLRVAVRGLSDDHSQSTMDGRLRLGPSAYVETKQGQHIILCSIRDQVTGRDAFTGLGATLHDKAMVVVKSMQHFHADFAPHARAILYVAAPGALSPDFAAIPYSVRPPDYWPRIADPHGIRTAAAAYSLLGAA